MAAPLEGKKVLIIAGNWGVEQVELLTPMEGLREAGATVEFAATEASPVECFTEDRYPGKVIEPDLAIRDAKVDDYDLLVIPGGTCNMDRLRITEDAIALAQGFARAGKTIAAICHGPWLLVNAGLVEGRTLTSCPFIVADLKNAGGTYLDQELVVEEKDGWKLVSSRLPDDLDAFVGGIKDALSA